MPVAELRLPIGPELDTGKTNAMVQKFLGAIKKMVGAGAPKLDGEALGVNELAKKMGELTGTFNTSNDRLNQLAKDGKAALAQMLTGGKQNTVEFQQMLEEVKKVTGELGKMKDAQAEVEKLTGGGGGDQQGGSFVARAAAVSQMAEGLGRAGDAIDAFAAKGTDYNEALKLMAVRSGLTGDEFERLKDRGEDAFRLGVGESIADATKIIGAAQQALGKLIRPEELAGFTQVAAGIGKAYDKDVNEVIAKSRTLIQNFKLGGEEAGNLIALVMRDAGNATDDVLDTLDEYAPLAAKAGLSAEEFTSRMIAGVQAGARDTDKLADAIKETGIRINEGIASEDLAKLTTPINKEIEAIIKLGETGAITSGESVSRASEAIDKAFDAGKISDVMRSKLQIAISGTPAEELGTELYSKIFSADIDVGAIQAKAEQAGNTAANAVAPAGLFAKIGKELELVTTKASAMFAPVLAGAGDVLKTVGSIGPGLALAFEKGPALAGKLLPMLSGLVPAFGAVATAEGVVGTTATATWSAVIGPLLPIAAAIAGVVAAFVLAYNNIEEFREGVDALVQSVEDVVSAIVEWAVATYNEVKPALEAIALSIFDVGKLIFQWLVTPIKTTVSVIGSVVGWIGKMISKLFESKGATKAAGDGMSSLARVVKFVTGFLTNLRAEVAGVGAALSFAGDTIVGFVDDVIALRFESAKGRFANFFSDLSSAYDRGKQAFTREAAKDPIDVPVEETVVEPKTGPRKTGSGVTKEKKDEKAAVSAATKALQEYNKAVKQMNEDRKTLEGLEKEERARKGIEQSLVDQILDEQERLEIQRQQVALAEKLVATTRALKGATKEEIEAAEDALAAARDRATTQSTAFLTLRAKLVPEIDDAKLRELARQRLQIDIEMGVVDRTALLDFLRGDIAILEEQLRSSTANQQALLDDALAKKLITDEEYREQSDLLAKGAAQSQVELTNQIAAKTKEIRDIQYADEQKQQERATATREKRLAEEIERGEYLVDNALRILERASGAGLDQLTSERLARIERIHDRELMSDEEFEFKRAEIEADAASQQMAIDEGIRAARLEAERQAAVRELEIARQKALEQLALANKYNDAAGAQKLTEQLGDLESQIADKGSAITGLAGDLQGNLTEVFTNLLGGEEEKVKDPFRRSFALLAGALQQLASAKITEVLLGSISGLTGIPGLIASFASKPLISGIINAALAPLVRGLLSFSTGGRVTGPTLAMIGDPDPGRYGSRSEWIFRDDQLRALTGEIARATGGDLAAEMRAVRRAVEDGSEKVVVLSGAQLAIVAGRTARDRKRRVINTRGKR